MTGTEIAVAAGWTQMGFNATDWFVTTSAAGSLFVRRANQFQTSPTNLMQVFTVLGQRLTIVHAYSAGSGRF